MRAGRAVFVVDVDVDPLADRTLHVELGMRRETDEARGHVNLEPVLTHDPVRSQVLALQVRVDRHVKLGAASTYRWHEVDGRHATTLFDQGGGLRCYEQLHLVPSSRQW